MGNTKGKNFLPYEQMFSLTLLHSEQPKLCGVLAILSAIGLKRNLHFSRAKVSRKTNKNSEEIKEISVNIPC